MELKSFDGKQESALMKGHASATGRVFVILIASDLYTFQKYYPDQDNENKSVLSPRSDYTAHEHALI
jgi:hypothetical protein